MKNQINDIRVITDDSLQEEEHLIQATIKPFLEWHKNAVLESHKTTIKQKVIRGIDVGTGLLASAIVAPLGYRFGIILANALKISNTEAQQALAYYFATTATGSAAVLVGRVSNSVLEQLVTPTPNTKKALMHKGIHVSDAMKFMLKTFLWCSATLSAVPESYLAYDYFSKVMGWWSLIFVSADMEVLTIKNGWAIQNLIGGIYGNLKHSLLNRLTRDEVGTIRKMRVELRIKLQRSMAIVSQLNNTEIETLFNDLFQRNSDVCINTSEYRGDLLLEKMQTLFNPPTTREITPQKKPLVKTLFGYFGSVIGTVGAYPFYPIAKKASEQLMDAVGIEDSAGRLVVSQLVGAGAYIARSALAIYATADSFEKFYDWVTSLPSQTKGIFNRCRALVGYTTLEAEGLTPITCRFSLHAGLTLLGTVISLSGGAPRAAMTDDSVDINSWYAPLLIACAFVGAFATNFWAVHGFVNDIFNGNTKRARLIGAVAKLIQILPEMEDQHIKALYDHICLPASSATSQPRIEEVPNDSASQLRISHA